MYFFFKTNEAERSVPMSDIVYFESMGHNIFLRTVSSKFKIKRERENAESITSISKQFDNKGFIRVHKSYLVNYRYIYIINRKNIVLKNNEEICINPHNVNDIKNIYQKFLMIGD